MIDQKSEAQVEKEIADALTLCGFKVLKTSAKRTKGGYGIDKGIPDRLAFIPGANICIGLEIKKSEKAKRKPEQIALNDAGCYVVAWSVDTALNSVFKVLESLETWHSSIRPIMRKILSVKEGMK